jgi:tetratricopeptide (TPR) repeat protein
LLASLGSFLIFALATRIFREDVNRLLLPIFLIIVAIIFLFFNATNLFKLSLPREQVLEQGISWKVAFKAATENVKNGFLGSGIGTYYFDFVKNKPEEFNKNLWWQIRFDRAGSYVAEIFGTMGFLGLFALLTIFIIYFLVNWLLVQSKVDSSSSPFLLAILAIFFSQFFYYQNTVLAFSFWLILGLGIVSWQKPLQEKTFSFKDFPELSLVFSTLLILFFLGILMTYYFGIRFYLADINYLKGQLVLGEERNRFLEGAVSLNQSLATYQVVLARSYLLSIFEETAKPTTEIDAAKVQNLVAKAIDRAKIATELSPNSVSVWETSGMIYRDIQPLATGATDWSIKSFERAITLEPKNPVLYTELGKLYLGQNDLQKARENFAKAKELKSDYVDALIQEALVLEKEQKFDEAIGKMEELARNYPFNIDVRFQLGRLYFNKDRVDEAITQFENIITLLPNHSNSLYSLGLAYTKKGEKEKAISAFEKVLELNPGNQDVIQKLEELKK